MVRVVVLVFVVAIELEFFLEFLKYIFTSIHRFEKLIK